MGLHTVERSKPKALLLYVHRSSSAKEQFERVELEGLVEAAEFQLSSVDRIDLRERHPNYLVGSGTLERIQAKVAEDGIDLVIFGVDLTAPQERNLERAIKKTILDRTALLLHLFALRAQSDTGRLQVEQAKQAHLASRLTRAWTHLERQKGGIGLRSGAGEKQIEVDRRLIKQRALKLQGKLNTIAQQRRRARTYRQSGSSPIVALIGYTNAGKSTLFNTLTHAPEGALVSSQLFATLDPLIRQLHLPGSLAPTLLVDTVGFIHQLPEVLLEAFGATLEESLEADLLLHVIDAGDPNRIQKQASVESLLTQLGAEDIPRINLFNKADVVSDHAQPDGLYLSAKTGVGIEAVKAAIAERLNQAKVWIAAQFNPAQSGLIGLCYKLFTVASHHSAQSGEQILILQLHLWRWQRFCNGQDAEHLVYRLLSEEEVAALPDCQLLK